MGDQKILLFLLYAISALSTLCIFVFHSWFFNAPRELLIIEWSWLGKMNRKLPDCIIIGVKNSGARALLDLIGTHPDIEIATKELDFFNVNSRYEKGLQWYR